MITAPSCSGEFGQKMLSSRSVESRASMATPFEANSPSGVERSMTSSAPKRRSASCWAARAIVSARRMFGEATVVRGINDPARPSCSSARRISGWNNTGMAKISAGIELRSKNCIMVRLKTLLRTKPSVSKMRMPRTSVAADVPEIRLNSQYRTRATIAMSSTALTPNRLATEIHVLCSSASTRSVTAAKSICSSVLAQQPQQQRFLRVQAIFSLVVDDRRMPVHDVVGNLLAAMGGQAMHGHRAWRGVRHQLGVDLVTAKDRRADIGLALLAHAVPG